MAQNEQVKYTVSGYNRWAIDRIARTLGTQPSAIINMAVNEWLNDHAQNEVSGSKASVADYAAARDHTQRTRESE